LTGRRKDDGLQPAVLTERQLATSWQELAGGDAAMQKVSLRPVALSTADDELALLDEDFELVLCESRNSERDPQALGRTFSQRHPLDIVGRITIARRATYPLHGSLDSIEAEQEGRIQRRHARHGRSPQRHFERHASSLESTMSVQEKYVFFLKGFKEQRLMRPRLR